MKVYFCIILSVFISVFLNWILYKNKIAVINEIYKEVFEEIYISIKNKSMR